MLLRAAFRPVALALALALGLGLVPSLVACGSDALFGGGTGNTGTGNTGNTVAGAGGSEPAGGGGHGTAGEGGDVGGAAAGGSGATSPGGGGQGAGPPEDCTNGADDDGDQAIDCADPECGSFACVPAVPGAVAYFVRGSMSDVCAAPTGLGLYGACESCECGATSGWCELSVESYSGQNCSQYVNTLASGTCANTSPDGSRWFLGTIDPSSAGECTAATPEAMSTDYYGCQQLAAGSCDGGGACVSSAIAAGETCVVLAGEQPCPAPYVERHVVWPDTVGSCTCGCEISQASCESPYVLLDSASDTCASATTVAAITAENCTPAGPSRSFEVPWLERDVECAPRGELLGGGAHTLCCES